MQIRMRILHALSGLTIPTLTRVDSESDADLARIIRIDEGGRPVHHIEGHAGSSAGPFLGAAPGSTGEG